jgi:hypothetical protein
VDDFYEVLINGENVESVLGSKYDAKMLGAQALGSKVNIGDKDCVVLEHSYGWTSLITDRCIEYRTFDNNSADYEDSDIRRWLNSDFYRELVKAVGSDNIKKHTVDLMADNGTDKGHAVEDFISLITTAKYREYRELIKPIGKWWWTATRADTEGDDYARRVCSVGSDGVLYWSSCSSGDGGARPFFILNSSILIK